MKLRIISVLLTVMLTLSLTCVTVGAKGYENLTAIGVNATATEDYITRGEFAYIAAKAVSSEDRAPINTRFEDVKESDLNSGYIEYLSGQSIINGVSETEFAPNGFVSSTAAAKIMVHILGFDVVAESRGGYPEGYLETASKLGLFKNAPMYSEKLTKAEALEMFESMLLSKVGTEAFTMASYDIRFHDIENNFLTAQLHYSVYEGLAESCNAKENTVRFTVKRNLYESNYKKLTENTTVSLKANDNVDVAHFEGAKVKVWANDNDEIIYMSLSKNYEVRYGYIYSVNGDEEQNSNYLVSAMERIALSDDEEEYDIADNAKIYLNGTTAPKSVKPMSCFCKIVTDGDEITALYLWEMTEGGLITGVNSGEKEISCIKGASGNQKWNKSSEADVLTVFIDGRRGEFEEIKANSVFAYYLSKDRCIISVSERLAVDTFESYSDDEITIGAFEYRRKNSWFSSDGEVFGRDKTLINKMIGCEVTAYFSPDGYASYIIVSSGEISKKSFYGVVSGVNSPNPLKTDIEIELFRLGDTIEKLHYVLTDKTKFNDGLTLNDVAQSAKNLNGEGVYYFTANAENKITAVEKCTAFTGYGTEAKVTLSRFTDDILAQVDIGGKMLYFSNTSIAAIYDDDGEFSVSYVPWISLYGNPINGTATMSFYSKEENAQPDIAVLSGDIMNVANTTLGLGVVVGKSTAYDAGDDNQSMIELLSNMGRQKYAVSVATAQRLSVDDFVVFNKRVIDAKEQISVSEISSMAGDITGWETSLAQTTGIQRGTVRKIDAKRLYVETANGDEVYFMHPYSCMILKANSKAKNEKFSTVTTAEINAGDMVCYYIYGGELRAIIVQK